MTLAIGRRSRRDGYFNFRRPIVGNRYSDGTARLLGDAFC